MGWYANQGDPTQRQVYALLACDRRPRYVGVAQSADARLKTHWAQRNRRSSPVAVWLQGLAEPPEVWVIQSVPREQGPAAEKYWIRLLADVLGDLLNIVHGPMPHPSGWTASEEAKANRRAAMTGRQGFVPSERLTRNLEIARRLAAGESGPALAREYGVTHQNIYYIRKMYRDKAM